MCSWKDLQDRDIHMVLDTSAWAQLGAMGDVIKSMDIPLIVVRSPSREKTTWEQPFQGYDGRGCWKARGGCWMHWE